MVEYPHSEAQPEDSGSNVGTVLSRIAASALTQIDLKLQWEKLQIEAEKLKCK